jgi:hypothetical protein
MFEKKSGYNRIQISDIAESVFVFWLRWYKTAFFVVFFGICIWSVFLWYYSLYYFTWSDQQKQAYIESQSHRTELNQKKFEKALDTIDTRRKIYQSEPVSVKNIFLTDPKEYEKKQP